MSETYKAICARADVYSHPNADRLRIVKVCGYQTITSTPVETGDLVVFFPADGQISHEFLAVNNEYRQKLGMNQSPAHAGGFFEENRRVSTIRLRGQVSEGYIVRPEAFAYTGADLSVLTDGFVFDQLNGHGICNKYMTRATRQAGQPKPQKLKIKPRQVSRMFKEHVDTSQLRYYPNRVTPGSTVIISGKYHGTSGRTGNMLVHYNDNDQPWYKRWWNRLRGKSEWTNWQTVTGTRRVVKYVGNCEPRDVDDELRLTYHNLFNNLRKGETVYYEIVGYWPDGKALFHHSLKKDETSQLLRKQYPSAKVWNDGFDYAYGLAPGQSACYVYRITQTNTDGESVELSWLQVKHRCAELGVQTVPEIKTLHNWEASDMEALLEWMCVEGDTPEPIDPRHIREGFVVRVENGGTCWLKFKTFSFCALESSTKEIETYIDPEEAA